MISAKLTNNQVKKYVSLKHKKYRQQLGLFIADGFHPVEEAVKSGWPIEKIVVRQDTIDIAKKHSLPENLIVTAKAEQFDRISPSKTPQGILAILETVDRSSLIPQIAQSAKRLIACDGISDPGNLGTIIRTAAAFSYDSVILIGDCADIYNPKTVMATQGGLFKLPILEIKSTNTFLDTFSNNFELICFSGYYETPLSSAPELAKPLLIMGAEISGISPDLEAAAQYHLSIEQSTRIDSLNVSVAAGIAMYRFFVK